VRPFEQLQDEAATLLTYWPELPDESEMTVAEAAAVEG
jgi:hypothetical protein